VARERADGIEFADLRPFVHGDRLRRINWRATARSGEALGQRHAPGAEHRRGVFLDTFVEARRMPGGPGRQRVRA
jgi:uncharacterized protein (DUF58 family)